MKKLLMHACCGPCFVYVEDDLRKNGLRNDDGSYSKDFTYEVVFYNPNVHPKVEYERRKEAFIEFCKMKNVNYNVIDEYSLNGFVKNVVEQTGENKRYKIRCEFCYYMRLKRIFEYAKENNFDVVSTTLTISPYQNHELIKKVGKNLEKEYGIEFRYIDYREHFREGQRMARETQIYMQKYCGCVFSFDSGKWRY